MAAASPPAPASSSPPPPAAPDGDGDGAGCGAARCSSPTPAQRRRTSPNRSGGSARKSPGSRDFAGGSVLKSVNKSTLHFKKSRNRRSGSPNNWTPRKKTESYMKRKIKHLQEADGMTASLHETLGNANPHYTRMAREKIAAREAARKATDARKAAMVEASWCRILRAARIQNKNAEEVMEKAMLHATEAFEEARAMGVMMYDRPDCPHQQYEVESSSHTGAQSTHKVTASFQTAFQVDMEVSAAVKKAFVQLANSPDSAKREEFKELLWKISQNPDFAETGENSEDKQQLVDCSNEDTSVLKLNKENISSRCVSSDFNTTKVQESIDVVNIMLERLKALHEEELASLAVIVATSGLNAALQNERSKYHETGAENNIRAGSLRSQARRYSTAASFIGVQGPKKEVTSELPSLDKFLVKHLSKLEREVQEAREASRKSISVKSVTQGAHSQFTVSNAKAPESTSDLSSILVKHVSKLEKEILEAKKINQRIHQVEGSCEDVKLNDKQLEFNKIQPEAENNCDLKGSCESKGSFKDSNRIEDNYDCVQEDKENKIWYSRQLPPSGAKSKQGGKRLTRVEAARLEALKSFCTIDGNTLDAGLDKIFIKPIHRLEKEKREAREGQINVQKHPQKLGQSATVTEGGLDDILVKHVSRLEREKIDYQKRDALGEGWNNVPHDQRRNDNSGKSSDSLDQVLVKHVSRLEREKLEYEKRNALGGESSVQDNKEMHCNNAAASDSLDQILVKHVSRLEKEKIEHEKDGGMILLKKSQRHCTNEAAGSLADIFVKRPTKLEQAKLASAAEEKPASGLNPVEERRRARQKELLDAWGGMGLGNSMKPHVSKIERDKAAWRIAEDEQKQMAAAREP
ncbi:uncharacterized protein LOC8062526 [Sorghum bicolor]|uniref:Uncharacterized protein n=1 Tax=Sorghum bicolor TaxID=4558 RepID=C5WT70_SORBI|nr:uncharacterized protein LOC8062526 [Sorghum bicolor]EER91249.1 hypothetical protein SORBI_3001G170800 [Sorghum bicolor]|eukprot:XP_002464251.1 uncharacterized protein LOC8062526 [Sorghum bicolor]